jgi:hypothetical protein
LEKETKNQPKYQRLPLLTVLPPIYFMVPSLKQLPSNTAAARQNRNSIRLNVIDCKKNDDARY